MTLCHLSETTSFHLNLKLCYLPPKKSSGSENQKKNTSKIPYFEQKEVCNTYLLLQKMSFSLTSLNTWLKKSISLQGAWLLLTWGTVGLNQAHILTLYQPRKLLWWSAVFWNGWSDTPNHTMWEPLERSNSKAYILSCTRIIRKDFLFFFFFFLRYKASSELLNHSGVESRKAICIF